MKKLLAMVLALVMTLSLAVSANAAFKDADKISDTYAEAVDVLSGMKVFQGYPDGSFQPEGSITRAEVAAIVYRLYTGDVADKQASLYATYNKFTDMDGAAWAKGYIGYCGNAGLIKGYDAKTFGPSDKVTGYQALAMILRAVGYDKNGEFTGADWQLHVAQYAQQLGVLKNVKDVDLNAAASRQLVAELLFRTAATVSMVTYTPALGYQSVGLGTGAFNFVKNDTLGYKNFGLAEYKGYVVANKDTGDSYTVVAADRKGTTPVNHDKETGLDMIGHEVSGWYNAKSDKTDTHGAKHFTTTYSMKDLSTAETVLTGAELAGKMNAKTVYSDNYGLFTSASIDGTATKYIVIDKGEAIISLVQDVAAVYAINNFATIPTMSLNYGGQNGVKLYKQSILTGTEGLAIDDYVVTTDIAKKGEIIHLGKLEKTVTGVYSFKDTYQNITLADGTKLAKSPLFDKAVGVVPQNASVLNIAVSGVYLLDEDGRYVGYWEVDDGYLYGTYAYYTVDNAATAQLSYYLTGVTIDGQVVTKKISADQYNTTLIKSNVANLSTMNQQIDANNKAYDYVVTETATTDIFKVAAWTTGDADVQTVAGTVINKDSAVLGGAATPNYFVDENTTFYFVTGTAAEPTVQTVTGKTALLAGGDNYVLDGESVMSVSVLNYSVNTAANYHVDKVLVKAPYSANTAKDLYYVGSNASATPVDGTNPQVYGVYVHKNANPAVTAYVTNSSVEANTFYTHNAVTNAYGQTVETLTKVPYDTGLNGIKAYKNARTAAVGSYGLYIVDDSSEPVKVSNDAVVVDLRTASYPGSTGTVGTGEIKAISTYADLVAASAEYSFKVDAAGTSDNVTIVYIKSATIRDKNAQVNVSFTVKDSAGNVVTAPTADQGYTVRGGINNESGTQKAGIYEYIYFTVGKDVASVTVNNGTVSAKLTSDWINGEYVENVYVVNASTDLNIVLTLKAPAKTTGNVKYTIQIVDEYRRVLGTETVYGAEKADKTVVTIDDGVVSWALAEAKLDSSKYTVIDYTESVTIAAGTSVEAVIRITPKA